MMMVMVMMGKTSQDEICQAAFCQCMAWLRGLSLCIASTMHAFDTCVRAHFERQIYWTDILGQKKRCSMVQLSSIF